MQYELRFYHSGQLYDSCNSDSILLGLDGDAVSHRHQYLHQGALGTPITVVAVQVNDATCLVPPTSSTMNTMGSTIIGRFIIVSVLCTEFHVFLIMKETAFPTVLFFRFCSKSQFVPTGFIPNLEVVIDQLTPFLCICSCLMPGHQKDVPVPWLCQLIHFF